MIALNFDLTAEIAAETARRANNVATLEDLSSRVLVLEALDRIAAATGRLRALKLVECVPAADRRAQAIRLLCDLSQKTTPADNEGIAVNAERDTYAVLIERNLV